MSSTTTTTAPSGTTTAGPRIITTTFSTAWATWTAVIDVDHSTTIALYQDGTSVTASTTLPSNTRPSWPRPTSTQRPPGQAPSSLYLLTFAITLSLLLSISLAILLRNLVQRARERRIREAVAAGLIPPDSLTWIWRSQLGLSGLGRWGGGGGGAAPNIPRRVGPQPVLWDSWLGGDGAEKGHAARQDKDRAAWAGITPLSISPLTSVPPVSASTTDASTPPPPRRRTFVEFIFHLPPMPYIPPTPPSPVHGTGPNALPTGDEAAAEQARQERMVAELFREASPTPSTMDVPPPGVRVALYIAMPRDPRRVQTRGAEEGDLANVDAVLGTCDVRWNASRPPLSTTSGPASGSGSNVR